MDIQPTTQQQPVSDDNELAKVLGGSDDSATNTTDTQETTPTATPPVSDVTADASPQLGTTPPVAEPAAADAPNLAPPPIGTAAPANNELDSIKKAALEELRPLADKLNLPPEEKFDTLLLIIRSTDDKELIGAAHEAAKSIPDETRRAQALLDIIKEVEYFSNGQQNQQQTAPATTTPLV